MTFHSLIKPIVLLMSRLSNRKQLAIIGMIAFTVFAILIFQLINISLTAINFAKHELQGVDYIQPLMKMVRSVQEYRQLTADFVARELLSKEKLEAKRIEIAEDTRVIDEKDAELGQSLASTNDWNRLKSNWQVISANEPSVSDFDTYTTMVESLLTFIIKICDTSELTLDPDIDTYYLMDAWSTKIPPFIEETSLIRSLGRSALKEKSLDNNKRNRLIFLKTLMFDFHKPAIKADLDKVLAANPSQTPKLSPISQIVAAQATHAIDLLNEKILAVDFNKANKTASQFDKNSNRPRPERFQTEHLPPSFDEQEVNAFDNEYSTLIENSYLFGEKVGLSLKNLLEIRQKKLQTNMYINLAVAILSLLGLLYLFIGLAINLSDKEQAMHDILEATVDGIIVTDKKNKVVLCNRAAKELFGEDRGELIGKKFSTLMSNIFYLSNKKRVGQIDSIFNESKDNVAYEAQAFHKDGTGFPIELYVSKLKLTEHTLAHVCVMRDITEQKQRENYFKLRHSVAQLLVAAANVEVAIPEILKVLGETLGLEVGMWWQIDQEKKRLSCLNTWCRQETTEVRQFIEHTIASDLEYNVGLPGRVWKSKKIEWIENLLVDTTFLNGPWAAKANLHSAFAFPLFFEDSIFGVYEFYQRSLGQPEENLLETLSNVSNQVSIFIARQHSTSLLKQTKESEPS